MAVHLFLAVFGVLVCPSVWTHPESTPKVDAIRSFIQLVGESPQLLELVNSVADPEVRLHPEIKTAIYRLMTIPYKASKAFLDENTFSSQLLSAGRVLKFLRANLLFAENVNKSFSPLLQLTKELDFNVRGKSLYRHTQELFDIIYLYNSTILDASKSNLADLEAVCQSYHLSLRQHWYWEFVKNPDYDKSAILKTAPQKISAVNKAGILLFLLTTILQSVRKYAIHYNGELIKNLPSPQEDDFPQLYLMLDEMVQVANGDFKKLTNGFFDKAMNLVDSAIKELVFMEVNRFVMKELRTKYYYRDWFLITGTSVKSNDLLYYAKQSTTTFRRSFTSVRGGKKEIFLAAPDKHIPIGWEQNAKNCLPQDESTHDINNCMDAIKKCVAENSIEFTVLGCDRLEFVYVDNDAKGVVYKKLAPGLQYTSDIAFIIY